MRSLSRFDVADDADHLAAGVQAVQGIEGDVEGGAVQGAEAFVEEQRVDAGLVLTRSDNARPEPGRPGSPPDNRPTSPCQVSITAVQVGIQAAYQLVIVAGALLAIGEEDQLVERQALGKAPEAGAIGRTDQPVEQLPALAELLQTQDFLQQCLLLRTTALVVGQACADFPCCRRRLLSWLSAARRCCSRSASSGSPAACCCKA